MGTYKEPDAELPARPEQRRNRKTLHVFSPVPGASFVYESEECERDVSPRWAQVGLIIVMGVVILGLLLIIILA